MMTSGKKNGIRIKGKNDKKHQKIQSDRDKLDEQKQIQKDYLPTDFSTVSYQTKIIDKPMVKIVDIDKQVYSQYMSKHKYEVRAVKNDNRYVSRGQMTQKDGFRKKINKI